MVLRRIWNLTREFKYFSHLCYSLEFGQSLSAVHFRILQRNKEKLFHSYFYIKPLNFQNSFSLGFSSLKVKA